MMSDFRGGWGVKQNRTKWDKGRGYFGKNRTSDISESFATFLLIQFLSKGIHT